MSSSQPRNKNNDNLPKSAPPKSKSKSKPPAPPLPVVPPSKQEAPPAKIAIENVEFILQDQKANELKEAAARHKSKMRQQRHRRNESFGKTPSITEEPMDFDAVADDRDWLKAVAGVGGGSSAGNNSWRQAPLQQQEGSLASLNYVEQSKPSSSQKQGPNDPKQQRQQRQQKEHVHSYMIPLQGSEEPPAQPSQDTKNAPYAPWPMGSGYNYYKEKAKHHRRTLSNSSSQDGSKIPTTISIHEEPDIAVAAAAADPALLVAIGQPKRQPLKTESKKQQQSSYIPVGEEIMDDEYAALLQQNFAGGYGATATASTATAAMPLAFGGSGRQPQHQLQQQLQQPGGGPPIPIMSGGRGYPPPPRGRGGSRDSPSAHYQQHKQPALPNYPREQQQQQQQQHQHQTSPLSGTSRRKTWADMESGYYAGTPTTDAAPPPPPPTTSGGSRAQHQSTPPHIHRRSHSDNYNKYILQQQQQYQYQQQVHPLLRNETKPPRGSGVPSPRGGIPRKSFGTSNMAATTTTPTTTPSRIPDSPGHRRARSGSGRLYGLRHPSPPMAGAALSPSLSFGNLLPAGAGSSAPRSYHRRSSSVASTSAVSVQSEASFMSVVSDIRKSSFYSGYDHGTGQVQMHYPRENVHLSTSKELRPGWIYAVPVDTKAFEEYHRQAEEAMWREERELDPDLYDDMEDPQQPHKCTCHCAACYHGCTGDVNNPKSHYNSSKPKDPFSKLPTTTFALAIDENIYKRVLDEISQSNSMPCGLFYCGHHEDVAHPSIKIAVLVVMSMLLAMAYVAFCV